MIKTIRSYLTVPLMMLLIATTTLIYTGYRAQLNQENQTARSAGFEVLKALNELQMITDAHRYTPQSAPSYLSGWTQILLIDDMSGFIAPSVKLQADVLHQQWQDDFEQLHTDNANEEMTSAINATRTSLKEAIQNLH